MEVSVIVTTSNYYTLFPLVPGVVSGLSHLGFLYVFHIHARVGWVDEIKHGLIVAGSGALTLLADVRSHRRIENRHETI